MLSNASTYSITLHQMGFKKGDTIFACMSKTPEFIYLMLASVRLGCKFQPVDFDGGMESFKRQYYMDNPKMVFFTDDKYEEFKDFVEECPTIDSAVLFGLTDSTQPSYWMQRGFNATYKTDVEAKMKKYKNEAPKKVMLQQEFVSQAHRYDGSYFDTLTFVLPFDTVDLNDVLFSIYAGEDIPNILYTGRDILNFNGVERSIIEEDKVLVYLPPHDIDMIKYGIFLPILSGAMIALEPFYKNDLFPESVLANEPSVVFGRLGFWKELGGYLDYYRYKDIGCPYLRIPFIIDGTPNKVEKTFLDRVARDYEFGLDWCNRPNKYGDYFKTSNLKRDYSYSEVCEPEQYGEYISQIEDILLEDSHEIMDAVPISLKKDDKNYILFAIEFLPTLENEMDYDREFLFRGLKNIVLRCNGRIPEELKDVICFGVYPPYMSVRNKEGRIDIDVVKSQGLNDVYTYREIEDLVKDDAKTFMIGTQSNKTFIMKKL